MPEDFDDEIRRLSNRIKELEELMRTIFQGERVEQEEKAEAPTGTQDLYDVGQDSYLVGSFDEYKNQRKAAATSQEILLPSLSPSYKGEYPELYTTSFIQGYDSLDSLKRGLSKADFARVIREIFIASTLAFEGSVTYTVEREDEIEEHSISTGTAALMVELSGAVPDVFGVSKDVRGNVKYMSHRTPMAVLHVYDSFWFVRSPPYGLDDIAKPWDSLGLRTPENVASAIQSTNPVESLAQAGVLVGGNMTMKRFLRTTILPKVVRRDRNDLIEMTEEIRTLAKFLDVA